MNTLLTHYASTLEEIDHWTREGRDDMVEWLVRHANQLRRKIEKLEKVR